MFYLYLVLFQGSSYREGLTPVLSLLTECCRTHRNIRKFIKAQVSKMFIKILIKVMMNFEVCTSVQDSAVEIIFQSCKSIDIIA